MHLLFATSIVPDGTLSSGYEIANAAIIEGLRRLGAQVTVVGYCWPGKQPANPAETIVLGEVDVKTDTAPTLQKVAWLMRAVGKGMTFASVKLTEVPSDVVRDAIRRAGPFDGYVVNAAQFAGAYEGLFDDLPMAFVAHNVEHKSAAQSAEASGSNFPGMLFRREARLWRALEERLCEKARFVFTLADEDREALGVASDDRSAVLPLVTRASPPTPLKNRQPIYDAALIGTWTWQPNRIGLDWFLEEVTPHLHDDFQVRIAGYVPQGVKSNHPGVRFVGRVPDAEEFVRAAAVIPLVSRAGSGVQLKSIETFELGLPAVATSSSLRGIGHRPANCVQTDDPKAFAEALQRMARAHVDVDGRGFYELQRAALDARLRYGLTKAGLFDGQLRQEVPA